MASSQAWSVLYEDAALLAVNKPAGWETVVQGDTTTRCLTRALRRECKLPDLAPGHRLDRDTTGVQLFGKDAETVARLHGLFRTRRVSKAYLALCAGIPRNARGTIRRNLSKWGGGRRAVQVVKGRGGLAAETGYIRLAFCLEDGAEPVASLMLFAPVQGRTHQVRVHASALGYPILGDDQYGDRAANRVCRASVGLKRQALHAWRVCLPHPREPRELRIEAPLAADMMHACARLIPAWDTALSQVAWIGAGTPSAP